MWCESKNPHVQRGCKILASEEVKQFASIVVIIYIVYRLINASKHPTMRACKWIKKKTIQLVKAKGPVPKVPQPCVLTLDNKKVDIEKWVKQARMYVEPLEENRRVEMLLMLVDQNERTSLESHCLVDRPLSSDEHVEYLLKVITSMYKRKEGTPTQNKDRFLKRNQQEGETIADYAVDLRDTLYQAWPGLPRDQLEELLIVYFINGLLNGDMKARMKVDGPKTLKKAIEVGQIYEDMLNNNTNLINQSEFVTPPGYSLIETPVSNNKTVKSVRLMQNTLDGYMSGVLICF